MVVPFTSLEYLIYELIQLMRQPRALRSGSLMHRGRARGAGRSSSARSAWEQRSSAPATNVLLVPVDLRAV